MIGGLDLAADLVRRARKAGADQAEAYFEDRQSTRIELRDQQIETLGSAQTRGIGLRVIVGGATAYAYTPDLRPRSLVGLARRAVALAREASPDPDRALPELTVAPVGGDLKIFDATLAEVTADDKIELLRRVERTARETDPRVAATEVVRYLDSFGTAALASSTGLAAAYERSGASVLMVATAHQDGEAVRGYGVTTGHGFADLSAEEAGRDAAERAVRTLGGRPLPTRKATVLLEPRVAAELLAQVAGALSAESVLKGRSMFAERLGQTVGSPLVTLVDEGNLPGGLASAPFDGEGVPSGRTVLVEGGLLGSFLHSTYTARRTGVRSTGNAVRGSYRSTPEVGPTNFALRGDPSPLGTLLAGVQHGLLVLSTRNVGGINPTSGDYSVGASGVWIEDGQEVGPVSGVTIAAGMLDMLAGLAAVGDDFRWVPGSGTIGTPTLRIEGMTIAGT